MGIDLSVLREGREGGGIARLGEQQAPLAVGGGGNRGGALHAHQVVGHREGSAAAKVQLVALAGSGAHHKTRAGGHVGGLHQVDRAVEIARHRVGRHALRLAEVDGVRTAEGAVSRLGLEHQVERGHRGGDKRCSQDGGYRHLGQYLAGGEGIVCHVGLRRVDGGRGQSGIIEEGLGAHAHHRLRKVDAGDIVTCIEGVRTDALYALEVERGQFVAGAESRLADTLHRRGKRDRGQTLAVLEGLGGYLRQRGEVLQLVEALDARAGERCAEVGHSGGLGVAQLAVAVGVPGRNAERLHSCVGKLDGFFLSRCIQRQHGQERSHPKAK